MISAILSILGSSFMGTLLGGAFALFNKREDTKLELKRLQNELDQRDKDIELAKVEAQGRMFIASEETEAARFEAIGATAEADNLDPEMLKNAGWLKFLFVLAEAYRKMMRPAITTALLGGALWANYVVFEYLGGAWIGMTSGQKEGMLLQAFGWVTGQASACVAYWMVSRGAPR